MSRPEIDTLLMTKQPDALTDKQKISKIGHILKLYELQVKHTLQRRSNGNANSSLIIDVFERILREL